MPLVTVVIPLKAGNSPYITLKSLARQTVQDFDVVISHDKDGRGAAWARNRGLEMVRASSQFVLFSDDDITWEPHALEALVDALALNPNAHYSYGSFTVTNTADNRVLRHGDEEFNLDVLRRVNYISTMSLIRRASCILFDESLKRLQDWDYWLTMAEQGRYGVYCKERIFTTVYAANGITYSDLPNTKMRKQVIAAKHHLVGVM